MIWKEWLEKNWKFIKVGGFLTSFSLFLCAFRIRFFHPNFCYDVSNIFLNHCKHCPAIFCSESFPQTVSLFPHCFAGNRSALFCGDQLQTTQSLLRALWEDKERSAGNRADQFATSPELTSSSQFTGFKSKRTRNKAAEKKWEKKQFDKQRKVCRKQEDHLATSPASLLQTKSRKLKNKHKNRKWKEKDKSTQLTTRITKWRTCCTSKKITNSFVP